MPGTFNFTSPALECQTEFRCHERSGIQPVVFDTFLEILADDRQRSISPLLDKDYFIV